MAAALFLLAGYPLLIPHTQGGEVLEKLTGTSNYFIILLAAAAIYLLSYSSRAIKTKQFKPQEMLAGSVILLRILLATCAATYIMLLFKWWSHLGGASYDETYYAIDNQFSGVVTFFMDVSKWLGFSDDMYFYLFTLMFISGYMVVMVLSPAWFCRMLTASIAVMVIGGIAYVIAPAYGPFLYRDNAFFMDVQAEMRLATDAFRQSKGMDFDALKFEYVLGAMPSLHIAHSVIIALYASALNKRLAIPYGLILIYILIHASVTGFHYLIDIPAGLLVALAAIMVTEKLHKAPYPLSFDNQGNLSELLRRK